MALPVSRRNQQRKRRQKVFDPLKVAGYDNRPHKHSIWWQLLHNKWIVFGGVAVIAFFTVFGSCFGGTQRPTGNDITSFVTATPPPTPSPTPDPNTTVTPTPATTATPTTVVRRYNQQPPTVIESGKQYTAVIETSAGRIRVQLFPDQAPQAVNSFVFLARNRYYDGLSFQRVSKSFVQGGDAGSAAPGYGIPVEQSGQPHDGGAFVMARSNSQGTLSGQFYIIKEGENLPNQEGKDTVIGEVVSGLDLLSKLPARDPDKAGQPPAETIVSITIEEQPGV